MPPVFCMRCACSYEITDCDQCPQDLGIFDSGNMCGLAVSGRSVFSGLSVYRMSTSPVSEFPVFCFSMSDFPELCEMAICRLSDLSDIPDSLLVAYL